MAETKRKLRENATNWTAEVLGPLKQRPPIVSYPQVGRRKSRSMRG